MNWQQSVIAGLCTLVALAEPASAQDGPSGPPVTLSDPADPAEDKVCRREEVTGSRLAGRRICKTRAQWKAEEDALRNSMDQLQRGSRNSQRVPR
jgi:predicted secreted protein